MFPLPRILYAMSCDGLLFEMFASIHPKYQTPVFATLLSGLLAGKYYYVFIRSIPSNTHIHYTTNITHTYLLLCNKLAIHYFSGIMSAIFNLEQLIDMMSIGTLLAYSIVCICVLVLRYKDESGVEFVIHGDDESETSGFSENIVKPIVKYFNLSNIKYANKETERVATVITTIFSAY